MFCENARMRVCENVSRNPAISNRLEQKGLKIKKIIDLLLFLKKSIIFAI